MLGATRGMVAGAFLIEYGLLGVLAALVAGGLGTLAAYFAGDPADAARLGVSAGCRCCGPWCWRRSCTLALGFAGTWRALGAKPAPYLRNE